MKRLNEVSQKSKGKFAPPPDQVFVGRPHLAAACCDMFWDDAQPREPYGLSCNWASGAALVQLNDRENDRSCASTAPTFEHALDALEGLLAAGSLPWRYWRAKKGKQR